MKRDKYNIENKLVAYIREECLSRNNKIELDYEKNLFEAGIVDSAGLITFIGFIEREFNMSIPDEDLLPEYFFSIASIADYIRSHKKILSEKLEAE